MIHSPRYEARLAARAEIIAGTDALVAERKSAPPAVPRNALAAVAGALREPPGLRRPPVRGRCGVSMIGQRGGRS